MENIVFDAFLSTVPLQTIKAVYDYRLRKQPLMTLNTVLQLKRITAQARKMPPSTWPLVHVKHVPVKTALGKCGKRQTLEVLTLLQLKNKTKKQEDRKWAARKRHQVVDVSSSGRVSCITEQTHLFHGCFILHAVSFTLSR